MHQPSNSGFAGRGPEVQPGHSPTGRRRGRPAGQLEPGGASARVLRAAALILLVLLNGCGLIMRRVNIAYIAVTAKSKDLEIQVNRPFIERFKNRVTLRANFTVDKAMGSPNPGFVDGDLHFAGRSPQVALPLVGEIANAASQKEAMDLVHGAEGTGRSLKVTGVWRLWPEHGGSEVQEQGKPLDAYQTNNPAHVFELHPVTRIGEIGLLETFTPVEGFKPGGAQRTFGIYEKATCTLKVEPETVSLFVPAGLYNDVEFLMELAEDQQLVVDDGRFVIASALDLGGHILVKRIRTVFVKGSPPERAVRALKGGDRLHVYGIPRVDFAQISQRVRDAATDPAMLAGALPYEIIILGVYPKEP